LSYLVGVKNNGSSKSDFEEKFGLTHDDHVIDKEWDSLMGKAGGVYSIE